jgi:hypothetical protein
MDHQRRSEAEGKDDTIAGLVRAPTKVLDPQANLCPSGKGARLNSSRGRADRQQVETHRVIVAQRMVA